MHSELESIIQNLVVQLSQKDISEYPVVNIYRHYMDMTVHANDQLHGLFNNIDMSNHDLRDLFQCCGAEVVTLHNGLLGLRLNDAGLVPTCIYWIKCDRELRDLGMSDFYDTVKAFIVELNESQIKAHCINLGLCGELTTWRSILKHIVNDPSTAVFGSLDHPRRFFTPSTSLYVNARNKRDEIIVPDSSFVSAEDANNAEPRWFAVRKNVKHSDVL